MRRPINLGVAGAVFGILATLGCGRAASVFLDLPKSPNERAAAPARPQAAAPELTAQQQAPRPPIEQTMDRDSVLAQLPKDHAGNVDWAAALRDGVIRPRTALPGGEPPAAVGAFRFDFLFKGQVPTFDAYFPHSTHVEWLNCQTCHPGIFQYRNTPLSMEVINRGEACGRCHGKVAFPVATACERCHLGLGMPAGRAAAELLGDVQLARRATAADSGSTRGTPFPPARFSHWTHRIRYRCMACHPSVFDMRRAADTLAMDDLRKGEACGLCHNGRAAFGLVECNRCHVPGAGREPSMR